MPFAKGYFDNPLTNVRQFYRNRDSKWYLGSLPFTFVRKRRRSRLDDDYGSATTLRASLKAADYHHYNAFVRKYKPHWLKKY